MHHHCSFFVYTTFLIEYCTITLHFILQAFSSFFIPLNGTLFAYLFNRIVFFCLSNLYMQASPTSHMMQWTTHLHNVCGAFETIFNKQQNLFIGEVDLFLLGQTEIAFIKTNADKIIRREGMLDRVNARYCFLILQYHGSMQIIYKNKSITLNEGEIILLDPEERIEMYPNGLFSHISVHLSRDKLIEAGIHHQYWGKLNTLNMSGHLLKTMMQSISKDQVNLWHAVQDGHAFEDALVALIKPTILYQNYQESPLRQQAERYILEHLTDPILSPTQIANDLKISIRHLHRIFAECDQSITQVIQNMRLEKVKQDLQDEQLRLSSITQIALKWGFCDSAHCSKKFKQRYGISPREYRTGLSH